MNPTPTSSGLSTHSPKPRQHFLDWLRVLAFGLLIPYHTGMLFVTWPWHVKSPVTSVTLEYFMMASSLWRMPLLFLVSGAAVWLSMQRRSGGEFLRDRFLRLFLPLAFGMAVVVVPQVYYEYIQKNGPVIGFFDGWWLYLNTPSAWTWNHLWYLPYILTYSLLALPLILWLRKPSAEAFRLRFNRGVSHPLGLAAFVLLLAFFDSLLRPYWETTHNLLADWANFVHSLLLFLWGMAFVFSTEAQQRIQQLRKPLLAIGLAALVVLYAIYWYPEWHDRYGLDHAIYRLLKNTALVSLLSAMLGFAARYLNFSDGFLSWAKAAVYPFYILHQTVIVVLGYWFVQTSLPWPLQMALVIILTFGICWALYEGIIKRFAFTRLVFGMRGTAASTSAPVTAAA